MSGKIAPVVVASSQAAEFHNLAQYGFPIIAPHEIDGLFHIGICPLQIFHSDNLQLLNRYCLKIVFAHLDTIAVRSNHLLIRHSIDKVVFEDAFMLADKVVAISDYTKEDTLAYFGESIAKYGHKFAVIPQGFPDVHFNIRTDNLDTSKDTVIKEVIATPGFVLVIGNDLKHKYVHQAVDAIVAGRTGLTTVVLGPRVKFKSEDVISIESGGISDELLWKLYEAAGAIVFPSLYEGFGLPIAEAAYYGKNVVVADNSINHEVARIYKDFIKAYYFAEVGDIPRLLAKAVLPANQKTTPESHLRTITDYNDSFIDLAVATLEQPVDVTALANRWSYFLKIDQYMISAGYKSARKTTVEKTANYLKSKNYRTYMAVRGVYRKTLKRK